MSKHVLFVLTSHDNLGTTGKHTGFWLDGFAAPYYRFIDAGYQVSLASPAGGYPPVDPTSAKSAHETPATKRFDMDSITLQTLQNTIALDKINSQDYDGLFIPAGHGSMWDLVNDPINAQLVSEFITTEKPVATVGHGAAALVNALDGMFSPVIAGKTITGFSNAEETAAELDTIVPFLLQDMLKELGGNYECKAPGECFVVADDLLVTGQNPQSSLSTAEGMMELMSRLNT